MTFVLTDGAVTLRPMDRDRDGPTVASVLGVDHPRFRELWLWMPDGRGGHFPLWWRVEHDGRFAGWVGLGSDTIPPRVGHLAAFVLPAFRGRGIAPAAWRVLARWAFEVLGVRRVVAHPAVGNLSAQRMAEKAGMRPADSSGDRVGFVLDAGHKPRV